MELGNMLFGSSRGNFPIDRQGGWEEELYRLSDATGFCFYGDRIKNSIFEIFPYYWGNCTCGMEKLEKERTEDCMYNKPNFTYFPTNLTISWYKYPLRDAYISQDISLEEFSKIIDACIRSLK